MPDTDKIIEAEQNIQDLAKELNQLHTSANILKAAQDQVDAVLSSSKRVVDLTESYSNKAGQIITSLSEIKLKSRFEELTNGLTQLAESIDQLEMKLIAMEKETKKWQIATLVFVVLTLLISIIFLLA